jgi:protein-tyrosine phosphatase
VIDRLFGTFRGAVRLGLSYPEVALGRAEIIAPKPSDVRRLVFVCHGNICRSAFADVVAKQAGMNAASFGLSTSSGKSAYPGTLNAAAEMEYALGAHRTTKVEDYVPVEGDLLLAMETRHLRKLAVNGRLNTLPRTLLGLYGKPPVPHLHDPYELNDAYMHICLRRIERAIPVLKASFPNVAIA